MLIDLAEYLKPGLWGEEAQIYDVDDTLVDRRNAIRVWGHFWSRRPFKPSNLPTLSLAEVIALELDHRFSDKPITSLAERFFYFHHESRVALPGAVDRLKANIALGIHNYANTGRHTHWGEMTLRALAREGLMPHLRDVIHTPHKTKTAVSKANGIRLIAPHYKTTYMTDDDGNTIRYLAKTFADWEGVNLNYIHYDLNNRKGADKELAKYSNVTVIPAAQWNSVSNLYK